MSKDWGKYFYVIKYYDCFSLGRKVDKSVSSTDNYGGKE